ncbi:hypothetical protein SAMD00019534_043730, partial [Acytostelium subglobosum LB1]|uniref:hypothetical protein n=1 Tax=Acytostelium subglobosum LB1 TaxID=1410327 RepID=UPI0006451856
NRMRRTVVHNGEIKQIDPTANQSKPMDDVDVQFHYFSIKNTVQDVITNHKITLVKLFIWLVFQWLALKIEFGAIFFVISMTVMMMCNLGKRQKVCYSFIHSF